MENPRRLFVAVELPDEVKQQLRRMQADAPSLRATKVDNLHLTLHFIGDADLNVIGQALESISASSAAFELRLGGVGRFGGRGRELILWVGVEPSPDLQQLHRQLGFLLAAAGVKVETRPYSPHITIARGRSPRRAEIDCFLERHRDVTAAFAVDSIALVSSVPQPGGSVYRAERVYCLDGPPLGGA